MGCDIHLVLEKRQNDRWVGVDTFNGHECNYGKGWSSPVARSRNYTRFSALAGVRGDGPPPRGIPADASDTARLLIEYWGTDGHSHSWLPLHEAALIFLATEGRSEREEKNSLRDKYPDAYFFGVDTSGGSREKADDYRLLFWFDN